jgi:hypothetical protein
MVALNAGGKKDSANFMALEKKGDVFRVSGHGLLDDRQFQKASWTSERIDADGDGYDEVLFTGTHAKSFSGYKLILYVPKTHNAYSLTVETNGQRPSRAMWSANLLKGDQSAYRDWLRRRANALLSKSKK